MEEIIINGTQFEIKTSLKAIKELEKSFGGKKYMAIFQEMNSMDLQSQIKIVYNLVDHNELGIKEFTDECYDDDNFGLGLLMEYLDLLSSKVMYPNLTKEESKKKLEELMEN